MHVLQHVRYSLGAKAIPRSKQVRGIFVNNVTYSPLRSRFINDIPRFSELVHSRNFNFIGRYSKMLDTVLTDPTGQVTMDTINMVEIYQAGCAQMHIQIDTGVCDVDINTYRG